MPTRHSAPLNVVVFPMAMWLAGPTALIAPHSAPQVGASGRSSAIDSRTTRHSGYVASQRIRKRVEEAFGWVKTVAGQDKTRFRGRDRVGWAFTFAAAAYNLVRLPKLMAVPT